jgi:acyl transferase domain-containing protein
VVARELKVSHAFHSALVEPMLAPFERFAARLRFSKPAILLVSNLPGRMASDDITSPRYWSQHARRCVRFADGVARCGTAAVASSWKVGPRATLSDLARRCLPGKQAEFYPGVRDDRDDWRSLLGAMARLYELGIAVNWRAFGSDYAARSVPLPTYPFQRQRYWFVADATAGENQGCDPSRAEGVQAAADSPTDSAASARTASAEDSFLYQLAWRRQSLVTGPSRHATGRGLWLLFADRSGVAERLGRILRPKEAIAASYIRASNGSERPTRIGR